MASNDFNKEERVAFEQMLEGFNDAEVMAKNVSIYNTDQTTMERSGDTIWRPQPYIMPSYDGMDQSGNSAAFTEKTQLSVPASISFEKVSSWSMDGRELRDALQENRLGKGASQKLGSDINLEMLKSASNLGSMVVPVTGAASGFDDVALIEAIMNEAGVEFDNRCLALSTRDYNGMASNLANRQDIGPKKALAAYERAYVGQIASFDTWKLDYAQRIGAAAGAGTVDTTSAGTFYVPSAVTSSPTTSERLNKDNRFQVLTVSSTANVAAGDAFTITGVNAVHHITKEDTGQLKTFRVVSVDDGTTMTITPPLIDPAQTTGTQAEVQYQNVTTTAPSATAAINWLNGTATQINPFWHKDALEILPGRYVDDASAGMSVMKGNTDSGLELVMTKQFDIATRKTKYRMDTRFGVVNKAPEMSGIIIFNQ